jgi:beta-lactamase superfamily II metal-dependent hydrolase
MSIVKSLSVGNGDMFYIKHNSDNFTIIDCCLSPENEKEIVDEIRNASSGKGITRFISTHPDEDHFMGLPYLDDQLNLRNFYCVANNANKEVVTESFDRYRQLRDSDRAYHVYKGCSRRWMNLNNEERGSAGINILWPDTANEHYQGALQDAEDAIALNNMSLVARYSIEDGANFMWIGDLETDFMESIVDDIELKKTTVVFAPHHGRDSGKIPDSWLVKLDPQIIVIGEAPSRHLNYYTGYEKITQNRAWDITFDAVDNKVHMYASSPNYGTRFDEFDNEYQDNFDGYFGSITVETEYTLGG